MLSKTKKRRKSKPTDIKEKRKFNEAFDVSYDNFYEELDSKLTYKKSLEALMENNKKEKLGYYCSFKTIIRHVFKIILHHPQTSYADVHRTFKRDLIQIFEEENLENLIEPEALKYEKER